MSDNNKNWWMEIDSRFEIEQLESFKETKQLLKENDNLQAPKEEAYFNSLHDRIMAGVETKNIQHNKMGLWQRHRRLRSGIASVFLILAVAMVGLETEQAPLIADSSDQVLSDAIARSPQIEDTVLVYQHRDDYFVELAQENIDRLSINHLEDLMQTRSKKSN